MGEEKYWEKQQGEVKVSIRFLFIPITALPSVGFGSLGGSASLPQPWRLFSLHLTQVLAEQEAE